VDAVGVAKVAEEVIPSKVPKQLVVVDEPATVKVVNLFVVVTGTPGKERLDSRQDGKNAE